MTTLFDSIQIFAQDSVVSYTKVTPQSLAMIFAPSLLRCPLAFRRDRDSTANDRTRTRITGAILGNNDYTTKTTTTSPSIMQFTSEYQQLLNNAKLEQRFVYLLIKYLDVTRLRDEDDWIPTHGRTLSVSTTSSRSVVTASSDDFARSILSDSVASSAVTGDTTDDPPIGVEVNSPTRDTAHKHTSIPQHGSASNDQDQRGATDDAMEEVTAVQHAQKVQEYVQDVLRDSLYSKYSQTTGSQKSFTAPGSVVLDKSSHPYAGMEVWESEEPRLVPPSMRLVGPIIIVDEAD